MQANDAWNDNERRMLDDVNFQQSFKNYDFDYKKRISFEMRNKITADKNSSFDSDMSTNI